MKLPHSSLTLAASLVAAATCSAAFAQTNPADPASSAANASMALNYGGNPAGAMGAAALNNRGTVPNSAPLISGNAGTVGVNGAAGDAVAASSVNGNVPVATASESIGMRRERLRTQNEISSAPTTTAVAGSETSVIVPSTGAATAFAPVQIRSTAMNGRDQLAVQLNQNIEAGRRALAAAEAQARSLSPDARAEFDSAARQARSAERRLETSLRAAQSAPYEEWTQARETLASHYESFSQAVAHAQHLATAGSARSSTTLGRQ